ncbi:outer membrane protein assembly factor BamB family protein [Emticicia soli]|uniref:PQQ-binding-like beta-propeller repeat protein n=1 Tax=Emticicia soli TaxID=2027878 RepID=A0ABW5J8I7_9BACT
MKYRLVKVLRNIYSFSVSENKIIISDKNSFNIIAYDLLFNEIWRYSLSNISKVKILNDLIYAENIFGNENLILDSQGNLIENLVDKGISLDYFSSSSVREKAICKTDEGLLGIYDLDTENILWQSSLITGFGSLISNNAIFCISQETGSIHSLDINIGTSNWQFSSSDIKINNYDSTSGDFFRIINLLQGVLVVHARISTDILVGLDAEKGKLLWQLADFEYEGVQYPHLNSDIYRIRSNTEKTRLIGINRRFIEINPLDGKVLKYTPITPQDKQGKFTEYNGEGLIPFDGKAQGKYVYFSAAVREEDGRAAALPASVGVYNMETAQIEWLHVFKEFWQGGGNAISEHIPPFISNNRLYVLDIKGTLHIFEKED